MAEMSRDIELERHPPAEFIPNHDHAVFKDETAESILQKKAIKEVYTIKQNHTVLDAIRKMEEKHLGALLVVDDVRKVVGMFTERDYMTKVILKGLKSPTLPVKDVMSTNVVGVSPHTKARECMQLMTNKRFRHLPVVSNNQIMGVVSIGDLVKSIIDQQDETIHFQQKFINGLYTYEK